MTQDYPTSALPQLKDDKNRKMWKRKVRTIKKKHGTPYFAETKIRYSSPELNVRQATISKRW